jgi:hypothetical protein
MSQANIIIDYLNGNCPVQAEGTINGKPFYFRARGESWRLGIGGDPIVNPEWEHLEWFGVWPEAGWMEEEVALQLLHKAADRYHNGLPASSLHDET